MIKPNKVCEELVSLGAYNDYTAETLLPFCTQAVNWLARHIKEDADSNGDLALRTAMAMARFYIFVNSLSATESYGNFKLGDMTLKRDIQKEYEIEKELRYRALCEAAEILKDGGFYFASN